MRVELVGDLYDNEDFLVKTKKGKTDFNSLDNHITIEIQGEDEEIIIEEVKEEKQCKIQNIIIFILTFGIQAIFNAVLFNADNRWYKEIKAYRTKITIFSKKDEHKIYLKNKHEHIEKSIFIRSMPHIEGAERYIAEYIKNDCVISNAYFRYVKKLLAPVMLIVILLTVIS